MGEIFHLFDAFGKKISSTAGSTKKTAIWDWADFEFMKERLIVIQRITTRIKPIIRGTIPIVIGTWNFIKRGTKSMFENYEGGEMRMIRRKWIEVVFNGTGRGGGNE
jgi:hypothetical protein